MLAFLRAAAAAIVIVPAALVALSSTAWAQDAGANPCGNFDFTNGINCKIEVSGGCTAKCTPLKFEAACTGKCNATATQNCQDTCGTQCIAQCNPALLDCFAGCHGECDQPTIDQCKASKPNEDCVSYAKAQCDVHCKESCKVPPSKCDEHCTKCCSGSCTTQVNFDCDFNCMVDVKGGCTAKCSKPEGGIFCNDQYVHASDVQACIVYLANKGIKVDVSARGEATCDLTGCKGTGSGTGCAAAPGSSNGVVGALGLGIVGVAFGAVRLRRKNRSRK